MRSRSRRALGLEEGLGGIDIALAFDPETRARRLDYAATKMEFWLVRGMSAEEITEVFTSADPEELERLESADEDVIGETEDEDEEDGEKAKKITPSRPQTQARQPLSECTGPLSRCQPARPSANLTAATRQRRRQLLPRRPMPAGLGVEHVQPVVCDRGRAVSRCGSPPIYEELRARTRVAVEVPVEIELRR